MWDYKMMIKTKEMGNGEGGDNSVGKPLLYKEEDVTLLWQHPLRGE